MTNCTTKFTADWVIRALRDEMTSMTDDDRVAVLELLLQHECTDPAASALRDYLREVCARVQAAEAASKAA